MLGTSARSFRCRAFLLAPSALAAACGRLSSCSPKLRSGVSFPGRHVRLLCCRQPPFAAMVCELVAPFLLSVFAIGVLFSLGKRGRGEAPRTRTLHGFSSENTCKVLVCVFHCRKTAPPPDKGRQSLGYTKRLDLHKSGLMTHHFAKWCHLFRKYENRSLWSTLTTRFCG